MATISRRGFLRAARNMAIGGTLGALGLWRYVDFEATWFNLQHQLIKVPRLANKLSGLKLVHLSDLHLNTSLTPEIFGTVVDLVNQQDADIIAITGDFIDKWTDLASVAEYGPQLSRLQARFGTFAVLGNHDHREAPGLVREMLLDSGITELANRAEEIKIDNERLFVCGLDDYKYRKNDLEALLADFPEGERGILLVHEPDYADISAVTSRFSLQLSGHSHGGQIHIPVVGPPLTPLYGRKYPRGLYEVEDMLLYTTTGIGTIPPFVRFNCRPEVALFTLLPA